MTSERDANLDSCSVLEPSMAKSTLSKQIFFVQEVARAVIRLAANGGKGKLTVTELRSCLEGTMHEEFMYWLLEERRWLMYDTGNSGEIEVKELRHALFDFHFRNVPCAAASALVPDMQASDRTQALNRIRMARKFSAPAILATGPRQGPYSPRSACMMDDSLNLQSEDTESPHQQRQEEDSQAMVTLQTDESRSSRAYTEPVKSISPVIADTGGAISPVGSPSATSTKSFAPLSASVRHSPAPQLPTEIFDNRGGDRYAGIEPIATRRTQSLRLRRAHTDALVFRESVSSPRSSVPSPRSRAESIKKPFQRSLTARPQHNPLDRTHSRAAKNWSVAKKHALHVRGALKAMMSTEDDKHRLESAVPVGSAFHSTDAERFFEFVSQARTAGQELHLAMFIGNRWVGATWQRWTSTGAKPIGNAFLAGDIDSLFPQINAEYNANRDLQIVTQAGGQWFCATRHLSSGREHGHAFHASNAERFFSFVEDAYDEGYHLHLVVHANGHWLAAVRASSPVDNTIGRGIVFHAEDVKTFFKKVRVAYAAGLNLDFVTYAAGWWLGAAHQSAEPTPAGEEAFYSRNVHKFFTRVQLAYGAGQDLHLVVHAGGHWFGATRFLKSESEHGRAFLADSLEVFFRFVEEAYDDYEELHTVLHADGHWFGTTRKSTRIHHAFYASSVESFFEMVSQAYQEGCHLCSVVEGNGQWLGTAAVPIAKPRGAVAEPAQERWTSDTCPTPRMWRDLPASTSVSLKTLRRTPGR